MAFFIEVDGLLELEQHEDWGAARRLLYELWDKDKDNLDMLLRLMAECWYVLSEWGCCIPHERLSREDFGDSLISCTEYGLQHFKSDPRFLCMAGYMILLFPGEFYKENTDENYPKWEQIGMDLTSEAYMLFPEDAFVRLNYFGTWETTEKEYYVAQSEIYPVLDEIFPRKTAIEEYFNSICTPWDKRQYTTTMEDDQESLDAIQLSVIDAEKSVMGTGASDVSVKVFKEQTPVVKSLQTEEYQIP